MASSGADPDRFRVKMCSNPSRRIRIVGKIRGFTHQESERLGPEMKSWITVCKSQEVSSSESRVTVSLVDQSTSRKDASYELDYCYEQDEQINVLFSREVKHFIADLLNGRNASIIAYGARGSGKTYMIQGTENKPGLAVMAMAELLSKAEELGKSVSLSIYEVSQEHAYDLLDSKHPEVQVLEHHGKINLKGLSQVSVKTISDFQNILSRTYIGKPAQKVPLEQPKRSHKVLIMYLSSTDDNSSTKIVGKMNFVDLAGYEDTRRTSTDGSTISESTRINKSLHAVSNVVYALNANNSHVPYRESKLTRMLQESLGGTNHVLMITCLNPLFCQDTVCILGLASRSHQSANHLLTDSIKKARSSAKIQVLSAQKNVKAPTTPKVVKKQVGYGVGLSGKKASTMSKGRKLYDEGKKVMSNQAQSLKGDGLVKMSEFLPEAALAAEPSVLKEGVKMQQSEDDSVPDSRLELLPEALVPEAKSSVNCALAAGLLEHDISTHKEISDSEVTPATICDKSLMEHDGDEGKENICLRENMDVSPPLSERLQQISNNLKLVCSSTPLRIRMQEDVDRQHSVHADAKIIEPTTPTVENHSAFKDGLENTKYCSPWEAFSKRSSGMKNSLVQEYLKFLNTASKEELKGLRGIGEKRATYILELREESPEPFKRLEDLEDVGLSAKQIRGMMKNVAGGLFS